MSKAIKNIPIVKIKLSPIKAGNGFNPVNSPSLKNEVKLLTAIQHKYNKKMQKIKKIKKSFDETLNFIFFPPFFHYYTRKLFIIKVLVF